MRRLFALLGAAVLAVVSGCSSGKPPSSLFNAAGYHLRGSQVFYLSAFPGQAAEVAGADAASFQALDPTFGKDRSTVYVDGRPLAGADPATFALLSRGLLAADHQRVYLRDQVFSEDAAHFELLDGDLSRDSTSVYRSDGRVLSDDPTHFTLIVNSRDYLFTKDSRRVKVNGNPIPGADPATFSVLAGGYSKDGPPAQSRIFYFTGQVPTADVASFQVLDAPYARDAHRAYWLGKEITGVDVATFTVLNADLECSADRSRAYYRTEVIPGVDPQTFPPERKVLRCSEAGISFAS